MSKKLRIKKFDLPVEIYRSTLQVILTNDVQGYLKKTGEWAENIAGSSSVTWENEDGSNYIATVVMPFRPTNEDIIHEGNHAATIIAGTVGILPTKEEDEAYAYLNEFIVMKLYDLRKKVNKRK